MEAYGPLLVRAVLTLGLLPAAFGGDEGWPRWGGPRGDFTLPPGLDPLPWGEEGPGEVWSAPVGPANSSAVVQAGRVHVALRRGDVEVVRTHSPADGELPWLHEDHARPSRSRQAGKPFIRPLR